MSAIAGHLHRMYQHDQWANREVLDALRDAQAPLERSTRLLSHIVAVEMLWLSRIRGEPSPAPVWPEWSIDEIETSIAETAGRWSEFFETVSDADLSGEVVYRNSRGEEWRSTLVDVVTHVSLHGSYHRGQAAAALREAGLAPPMLDYIHATRKGLL